MPELSERAKAILRGHTHCARYWREIDRTVGHDGLPLMREHCRCGATRLVDGWHDADARRGAWEDKNA